MWRIITNKNPHTNTTGSVDVNDDGTVSILVPVDSLVTLTTLTSGVKGSFKHPSPASSAFPFPYADDFDGGEKTVGFSEANNFADQSGSFEFFTNHSSVDGHKNTLRQVRNNSLVCEWFKCWPLVVAAYCK